jgi:glycosyltransferase involved in cell wall biosynthesis
MSELINTQAYWNTRFEENWEERGGIEQSIFFSKIAVDNLPGWVKTEIARKEYEFCDWGCAFGDGTKFLKNRLNISNVTGVDFAESAIRVACKTYPDINFVADDYTKRSAAVKYDILFSSNTLAHFSEPWDVLNKIACNATKHVILLIPFKEYQRFEEHFYTFDYNNIPLALSNKFVITHSAVINAATIDKSYWPGKQLLLVYSSPEVLLQNNIMLENLHMESPLLQKGITGENTAKKDEVILQKEMQSKAPEVKIEEPLINEELAQELQRIKQELDLSKTAKKELEYKHQEQVEYYKRIESHYEEIVNSTSWKSTAFVRKPLYYLRRGINCYQDNGFKYTVERIGVFYKRHFSLTKQKKQTVAKEHAGVFKSHPLPDLIFSETQHAELVQLVESEATVDNKTKVAFLVQHFNEGGLERVVFDLAIRLKEKDIQTLIIVAEKGGFIEREAINSNIDVIVLHGDVEALHNTLNKKTPDVVFINHCYFGLDDFYKRDIPVLEIIHNAYFWQKDNTHFVNLRRKGISGHIAVSDFVRQYSIDHLGISADNISVINNGLNIRDLIRPTQELSDLMRKNHSSNFNFILSASIRHSKCHYTAFKALKIVIQKYPHAKLMVAGGVDDNDLFSFLQQKIKEEKLQGHIEFLGLLNRRQLSRVMAKAHCGILPSSYEGLSITSLEYLFFGLPMVLTDVGGAKDVLKYNNGILVPAPVNAKDLTNLTIDNASQTPQHEAIENLARAMGEIIDKYDVWQENANYAKKEIESIQINNTVDQYYNIIQKEIEK